MFFRQPKAFLAAGLCLLALSAAGAAQKPAAPSSKKAADTAAGLKRPKVTQIDAAALKKLLQPNGKPLLINFWATWCDPCREEFPDLVKLDAAYKGKIDFITISLDDLADINTLVPKFLGEMKAEMPAYLLKTPDESAAIALVSKNWAGNLPLTILYNTSGVVAYEKNGKIKYETATAEIDKVLVVQTKAAVGMQHIVLPDTESVNSVVVVRPIEILPTMESLYSYEKGVEAASRDFDSGAYAILQYGLTPAIPQEQLDELKRRYSVTVKGAGCVILAGYDKYVWGYNSVMKVALEKKFGIGVRDYIAFATTSDPAKR